MNLGRRTGPVPRKTGIRPRNAEPLRLCCGPPTHEVPATGALRGREAGVAKPERKDARLFGSRHTAMLAGAVTIALVFAVPAYGTSQGPSGQHKKIGKRQAKK